MILVLVVVLVSLGIFAVLGGRLRFGGGGAGVSEFLDLGTLQELVHVGIVKCGLDLAFSINLAGLCDLDFGMAIFIDSANLLGAAIAIRIGSLAFSISTFPASVSNAHYTITISRVSLVSTCRGDINYSNSALHTLSIRG